MTGKLFVLCFLQIILVKKVVGITLTKTPNRDVVLNSQNPPTTSFLCTLSSSQTITSIYAMNILRKRVGDVDFSAIATVTGSAPQSPIIPSTASDVSSRATVSEGIDTNTPTSSKLKLDFDTQKIVCTDEGVYKCTVTYPNEKGVPITDEDNTTLSVYALPYDIILEAKDSTGFNIEGSGTTNNPYEMNVGDIVDFSCSAKIGSDNSTKIEWKVTSQTSPSYMRHNPPTGSYDDGTASGSSNCSYTRTATMKYNVTTLDVSRMYGLAFQCYVSVSGPTGPYIVPNPPTFHIKALSDNNNNNNDAAGSTGTAESNAGVIAGAVVGAIVAIVIVVLLVYFLWYRRRSEGETYRTKEEHGSSNPNLADPTPDLYAVPHKERERKREKGHENRALDEPHESRPNYRNADDYDNSRQHRGHKNRGMERDDDYHSRDGSPSSRGENINHMGMDPNGSIGTGV